VKVLLEEFPERKAYCVDTFGATIGFGRFVLDAARMRDEGKSAKEIYDWLEENKLKAMHYFTVDDLFHLQRGGRMSAVKAIMGSALNIKPLLTVSSLGKLTPVGKAKGRKKSLEWLADKVGLIDVTMSNKVFITHGDSLEDAEYTAKLIMEKHKGLEVEIMGLDPVIGVHSGPGTIALFFMSQQPREA
jgi:DegV family protein with EDD domain